MKKLLMMFMLLISVANSFAQDGKRTVMKDSTQSITNVAQELAEVSVVTKIQKTRMNGDVLVTRVVGSALANAGTAEDALSKVPGLMRRNGQVEVIGKGAPTYYINGRKVQDITELSRLSSQEIREVEVINTPGSQYDAQTNAVVRIKTVKRRGDGWSGNLDVRDMYSPAHGDNRLSPTVSLNYRHNNLELLGGTSFNDSQLKGYETHFTQQTISPKKEFHQEGDTHMAQHYRSLQYNLGADWQVNDNHSLGFRVERNNNIKGITDYWMTDEIRINGQKDDYLKSDSHTNAEGVDSWSVNTYYNGKVGKLDIDWNIDYYQTQDESLTRTAEQAMNSQRGVEALSQAKSTLYATKLVFSYPLSHGKLQFGTELATVSRDNQYSIDQQYISNDHSKVRENTYAAFAEYSAMTQLGMFNLGLRYEHVDFKFKSLFDHTQDLTRHQDNLYPTISFATQIKEVQTSLSYSVKTRRPFYSALRSNIEYNNRYTLSTGNPKLQNEINHQVALNARWRYLSFSANYQCQKDGIYDWTTPYDDEGTVLLGWINFNKPIHSISTFLNLTNTLGYWTPSYTLGIQKQWLSFELPDPRETTGMRTVSYNRPMYICNLNNAFKIPSGREDGFGTWQVELNSEFLSKFHWGNAETTNYFWNLQLAVQKSWLENEALSVRFEYNDIFHTAHHNVTLDMGNYVMTQTHINGQSRSIYDPQTLSLSVRYKFNAVKSKYKGASAGAEIRSRM